MKHQWKMCLFLILSFTYAKSLPAENNNSSQTIDKPATVPVIISSSSSSSSVPTESSTVTTITLASTAASITGQNNASLDGKNDSESQAPKFTTSTTVNAATGSTMPNSGSSSTVTTSSTPNSPTDKTSTSIEFSSTMESSTQVTTRTIKTDVPPVTTDVISYTTPVSCSPLPGVKISETNILLTDSDSYSYFVEMQITSDVDDVWLVIFDASEAEEKILFKHNCIISNISNGFYTYVINNDTQFWNASQQNLESVLIALYVNETSADNLKVCGSYDILMYSSSGNISAHLSGEFDYQDLIIDYKKLNGLHSLSLSRCSEDKEANIATVLTYQSPGKANLCDLTKIKPLEMKLTKIDNDCSLKLFPDFNKTVAKNVISGINSKEHCGFAFYMLVDMKINNLCSKKGKEIDIEFTVRSAFPDQLSLIISGYQSFLSSPNLSLDGVDYNLSSCYQNCFHKTEPPSDSQDDKIRVTVAVLVSCITVVLLVLLFVFLYLSKKKKSILQFSMNRLDEDDDLIGNMDDFVGNQGPTFRSFK